MSIIIKGMDMPKSPKRIIIYPNGTIVDGDKKGTKILKAHAIEIPSPHGRLIDGDRLMEGLGIAIECKDCSRKGIFGCGEDSAFAYACEAITDAPTIFESEE